MRKLFASLSVGLILALVAFFSAAAFAGGPVQSRVNFAAPRLSGPTSSLGHTGVVVKIKSAGIANDGTISVRATIVDADGNPLDRLGVTTPGPVSLSFICARIPAGQTQYLSYTTATLAASINSNPTQVQAGNDSGGVFTANALGDYTYTFKTKAPAGFDAGVTHAIGVSASRNLAEYGTFDQWSEVSNDVFTFVPNGSAVTVTRAVVSTNACNQCHNPLFGHGGSRVAVELCIMCHTPQTVNPDTGLTMDMKVLAHKIHMGSSLPSVKAGTPYRVWHRGAWSDFSSVVFPQDARNCTTCHQGAAQADNWKTNPTAAACGSCHDNVNFASGQGHTSANLPQPDDNMCKTCHTPATGSEFDASIPGAHVLPNRSNQLSGLVTRVMSVDNATPGNSPKVTFQVTDKSGVPVDISKLTQIRVVLSGNNVDYGVQMARVSEDPSKTPGANGVYVYPMTARIPASASGSYTVSIEARNSVTLNAGTTKQMTASDNAKPVQYYFAVDSGGIVPRRQVVSTDKCAKCHQDLTFVHGGTRGSAMECSLCHNPTLVDGTSQQSVNMAWQIHSIHRGENLANPYVLGTTNFQEVRFPGDLRDCTTCHMPGTYMVENIGAKAMVSSPGGFTKQTAPIAAACQGCHDDQATASHALANTTSIGESCETCHGANKEFSVDRVHQRIF